jgi:hypothetical protein
MHTQFNRNKFLVLTVIAAPFLISNLPVMAQKAPLGKRSVKGGSWVDLQVSTNKLKYTVGEPIKVTLKATNIQEKDAYLKFTSGQRFDFQLYKDGGKEPVYTWSANKMFAMSLSTIKLKMAERKTYETEIGQEMGELKPGNYRLKAHLTNSSQVRAIPIDFTVVPGTSASTKTGAKLTATTDKKVYKVGEDVKVDFTLQNNPLNATTFNFRSGQNYDVFIKNSAGEPVWNWSANVRFIMVSRPITVAAGEKRDYSVTWNGVALPDHKITPGKYTVEAVFSSDPEVKAAPITIEIR